MEVVAICGILFFSFLCFLIGLNPFAQVLKNHITTFVSLNVKNPSDYKRLKPLLFRVQLTFIIFGFQIALSSFFVSTNNLLCG
jgi:phosphatidylserine synthase